MTTPKSAPVSELPSYSSVVAGRFVSRVELDGGALTVDPAGKSKPRLSEKVAEAMFRAAQVVAGSYRFSIFGLGVVTLSPQVAQATTTTGPATGSSTPGTTPATTSQSTTTTTTTTSTTTTTTTSATPSSTSTTLTTAPTAAPPRYDMRLAWVGIAWGADCPPGLGTTRLPTRYVAVVLDADTGHSVIAYTSRSAIACGGPVQPPSVSQPTELVSAPWQPVGPTSTAVQVTMPPCSTYYGWTDVAGTSAAVVEVVVQTPFDPGCGSKAPLVVAVDDVVPLGGAQTLISHAAVGPIDALRTLAAG